MGSSQEIEGGAQFITLQTKKSRHPEFLFVNRNPKFWYYLSDLRKLPAVL